MYVCVLWPLACSLALDGLGLGVEIELFVETIVASWLAARLLYLVGVVGFRGYVACLLYV